MALAAGCAAPLANALVRGLKPGGTRTGKMTRVKVLPVAEWGFGWQGNARVPIPRPFGTGQRSAPAAGFGLRPPPLYALLAMAPSNGGPRRGRGWPYGGRRFRLVFPGAPAAPEPAVRTLYVERGRMPPTASGRNYPMQVVNGRVVTFALPPAQSALPPASAYHALRASDGMLVGEGFLSRLYTEGEGLRLGPLAVVRFDPIFAVPE